MRVAKLTDGRTVWIVNTRLGWLLVRFAGVEFWISEKDVLYIESPYERTHLDDYGRAI